jgi:hypothetical protein
MPKFARSFGLLIIFALSLGAVLGLQQGLEGMPSQQLINTELEPEAQKVELEKLSPDKIKELQRSELEILAQEPLSADSLRNLVVLYGLGKNKEMQQQLALQISKYSKRNTAAQLTTIDILLSQRKFDEALVEIDALLRARTQTANLILPALVNLALDKVGGAALARTLKNDPPWRAQLFTYALQNDAEGNAPLAILNALRRAGADVRAEEIVGLIGTLISSKKIEKAYFIWLDFLPEADLRLVGRVFDGGFDRDPKNAYFDWTIARQNAKIFIAARAGKAKDRNLAIDFFDDKGFFANVFQYLQLAPGKYETSFEFMAQRLRAEQGLVWVVRCSEGNELGRSQKLQSSGPWQTNSFSFEIPELGCQSQLLRLESASAAELDTRISGQAFFDSIEIAPRASQNTQTPN